MEFRDIVDTAIELATLRAVKSVPGKLAEQYGNAVWQEWIDQGLPRLVRTEGTTQAAGIGHWYNLDGLREVYLVTFDDRALDPVSVETFYHNLEGGTTEKEMGYAIREEQIAFTGLAASVQSKDYIVIYYSDNPELSGTQEPHVPDKLHLLIAEELAYRFRESFGGDDLSQQELLKRQKNQMLFVTEMRGRQGPEIESSLFVKDHAITLTTNVGTLPTDCYIVKNVRQATTPSRNAEIVDGAEFHRRTTSSMTSGTFEYPLVGVDIKTRWIELSAGGYSGNLTIDYVRRKLKPGLQDDQIAAQYDEERFDRARQTGKGGGIEKLAKLIQQI